MNLSSMTNLFLAPQWRSYSGHNKSEPTDVLQLVAKSRISLTPKQYLLTLPKKMEKEMSTPTPVVALEQETNVEEATRGNDFAADCMEDRLCRRPKFIADSCQKEEIKTESTCDYDVCWFTPVLECDNVEFEAFLQGKDVSLDRRDSVLELNFDVLEEPSYAGQRRSMVYLPSPCEFEAFSFGFNSCLEQDSYGNNGPPLCEEGAFSSVRVETNERKCIYGAVEEGKE
ncbi:hypothetical protein SUGI_0171490 [Cryptomeria japonica]|nr:hypothetical protein SUGI_0171490 [Cryptomeria japonica]